VHSPGLETTFSNLATSIAEMTQQQSGRPRPIPPHIMAARKMAQDKLDALLAEVGSKIRQAQFDGDKATLRQWAPHWRVIAKFFISTVDSQGRPFARMVEPFTRAKVRGQPPEPQTIHWSGAPSLALRPINEIAKRIYDLHIESIGTTSRLGTIKGPQGQITSLDTRPYVAMVDASGNVHAVQSDMVSLRERSVTVGPDPYDPSVGNASDYGEGNDPRKAETHVLGTLHPATRKNQVDWKLGGTASLIEGVGAE
jgi:hypothetical protein